MSLDASHVLLLTAIISTTVGGLLIFTSIQSRNHVSLLLWGCADLIGAVAVLLLLMRGTDSDTVSIIAPMGLLSCTYAAMWAATRTFSGRRVIPLALVAGPITWCLACFIPAVAQSTERRVLVISLVVAAYSLASAYELWRDRREQLLSRYSLIVCFLVHTVFVSLRIGITLTTSMPDAAQMLTPSWVGFMALEPAIFVVALGFLQLSMAMERVERVQRRAATTDALTGVASRGAFFDQGEQRLDLANRDNKPVALLMFDLDHFKTINDRFGHEAGDDVLRAFTTCIKPLLGAGAVFGRLGGEEFAAVLTGATVEFALVVAERCRAAVEVLVVGPEGARPALSVSVGVAAAKGPCNLDGLLRDADRALYGVKSDGRNGIRLNRSRSTSLQWAA